MPNRIAFCWNNRYTAATTTLVASSELLAMPVAMSRSTDRSNVWRSATATGEQTIDIDLGIAFEATVVCVANAKVLGTGVIEVYERGSGGTAGAATLLATLAAQDVRTRAAAGFFASQTRRHWQLRWTNPTAASDYAEVGYVFLGTFDEPEFNVVGQMSQGLMDPSVMASSVDGQQSFAQRTKFHRGTFAFDAVRQAQLEQLQAMFAAIGTATPLFIVLDTAISWTCWFARIGSLTWEVEPGGALGRFGPQFPWEEVR